jgi:glucose/arabinose dehydrogenase
MLHTWRPLLATACIVGLLATSAWATVKVKLTLFVDGLVHPLVMLTAPDGSKRHFIVEQTGTIEVLLPDGTLRPAPFLDLTEKMVRLNREFDERGLLGMAFHPQFKENGKFYVVYSGPVSSDAPRRTRLGFNCTNYLSEFRVSKTDSNQADLTTERIIYRWHKPQFNHNGGAITFGPDGYLYISTGDGGSANDKALFHTEKIGNAQDLKSPLGKILRIDVNAGDPYTIPSDNPFVGRQDALPEIYAYGLRNPWRMAFDAGGEHQLFAADVGQNAYEEVDIIVKGANYGWNRMEGTHCFNPDDPNNHPTTCDQAGLTMPVIEYGNLNVVKDGKGISVTGGYIYRGKTMPHLQGAYVFGDWSRQFLQPEGVLLVALPSKEKGSMWTVEDVEVVNMKFHSYVLAFAEDEDHELYVMASDNTAPTRGTDKIYKIVPAE